MRVVGGKGDQFGAERAVLDHAHAVPREMRLQVRQFGRVWITAQRGTAIGHCLVNLGAHCRPNRQAKPPHDPDIRAHRDAPVAREGEATCDRD